MLKNCKKILLLFCCIAQPLLASKQYIKNETLDQQAQYLSKDQQLLELQALAEHINTLEPLHDYMLAVPPFIIITNNELNNFLSSIPNADVSGKRSGRKQKKLSIHAHLQDLWQKLYTILHNKDSLTPEARSILAQIREGIKLAFNHDITTINARLSSFIKKSMQQESPLIIHPIEDEPLYHLKSAFPAKPNNIGQAIGQVVASYYNDAVIEELLHNKSLPKNINPGIILQYFITNNHDELPLTSGICCPYDTISHTEGIGTIHAVYGNQSGLKDESISKDIFYIYQNSVYPIITKKVTRLEPDPDMLGLKTLSNRTEIQERPTLDITAVKELSQAINRISNHLKQPVCISFIKYSRTIYLLNIDFPKIKSCSNPSYIDDLYIKKARKDNAIAIECLTPQHEVIVTKKRSHIILAPDIPTLLSLYHEQKDKKAHIGIVKKAAEPWSHEYKLLDKIDIPIIWSSQFDEIKRLIDTEKWPIIIDPQHRLLFTHKKRKGFCTLFQTIEHGIKDLQGPEHISVMPSFIEKITKDERAKLNPDEFFSGVTMEHLFDLIKHAPAESSLQALRTVLYRLQLSIKRVEISLQESPENSKRFYLEKLSYLQSQYDYIEQIAYQIHSMLTKIDKQSESNKLQRLFLVNILELLIMQKMDPTIVNSISFNA